MAEFFLTLTFKNIMSIPLFMTLDRELVEKACLELWNEYHSKIEKLGYYLGKHSMMHSPDGISIIATIRPAYSSKMSKVFRKVIPKEYDYNDEKIPVIIFPSIDDLLED